DQFWRKDFELAATVLKCHWLRYSVPWQTIQPQPDTWDWSWCDEHFDAASAAGIHLIIDLVHFGVPTWLPDAFGDVGFPEALETFARAFGARYRGHPAVASVCPINEPLTTAYFGGDAGLWPPHGVGLRTYMLVLSRLAQALSRSIRALRDSMGEVEIIICDSLEVAMTDEPDSDETTSPHLVESLGADVARRMERRHVVLDLVLGRVDQKHALHHWLVHHGFPSYDLHWLQRHAQTVDVIGLDYYFHTEVEVYTNPEGYYRQRAATKPWGLYRAAQDYWRRYHLPFMVTETSAAGTDEERHDWLNRCIGDIRHLRADGFPCIGFTWWPLIDHLDWDGAMLHQTGHIHPVGVFGLSRAESGELIRRPTGLTTTYRHLIEKGDEAVGSVSDRLLNAVSVAGPETVARRHVEPKERPVIVCAHQPWGMVRTRLHHLAREWAKDRQVWFVDPVKRVFSPSQAEHRTEALPDAPFLYRFQFSTPQSYDVEGAAAALLGRVEAEFAGSSLGLESSIYWVEDAAVVVLLKARPLPPTVVFDPPARYDHQETGWTKAALQQADAVVFRTPRQQAHFGSWCRGRQHLLEDGVDPRHFLKAMRTDTPVPYDSRFIVRPNLLYFGVIDERLDLGLLDRVAEATFGLNMIMVGPVIRVAPESLPRRENLFWLGPRPYEQLPNYLRGVEACILPFRQLPSMEHCLPVQVQEYLCAGRPVVATPVGSLPDRAWHGLTLCKSAEDFARACHQAAEPIEGNVRREFIRQVAGRSWHRAARAGAALMGGLGR
ncbi:MAG TPA: family 1 glycosylhydrolase, partial [Chthoniobacterales bacterium]